MTDVTDLNQYRMQRQGDSMFLTCRCGSHEWAVVCVASQETPVVSALVCTGCGKESLVAWGKVE